MEAVTHQGGLRTVTPVETRVVVLFITTDGHRELWGSGGKDEGKERS